MTRIVRPDELGRDQGATDRRLQKLERAPVLNNFPIVSTVNRATQNQTVPPATNFDGVTKYDIVMDPNFACLFTLMAPTPIIWFSYATIKVSAPGGGNFVYLTTAVSVSPWNPAQVVFESGSQLFDKGIGGYIQSEHHYVIGPQPTEGSIGPGAALLNITTNLGPLPAGTYEVRQRLVGDVGTQVAYYQGNVQVLAPGG